MNSETDNIAREAVSYAHGFGDHLTLARQKSLTPPERQAAAAKAMMSLHLFEEKASELKKLMPRSTEEGSAMRRDLLEVGR